MTTREKVLELRRQDPKMLATRMADAIGVSRERVRQILKESELPTRFYQPVKHCVKCGSEIDRGSIRCITCEHKHRQIRLTLPCAYCGTQIERQKSHMTQNPHVFCNRSHLALWIWDTGKIRNGRVRSRSGRSRHRGA